MNESINGYRINSRDDTPAKPHETDYLRPKKGSGDALEQLHKGKDELGANCVGHEDKFIDYEEPPSDAAAATLCSGCPVFDLCKNYAETGHPAWGIWGGAVHGRSLA